jgi:HrpA-like RNA helicase
VTQPRRLPAIALATRVAAEMGSRVGDEVGYTVRFEDCSDLYQTGVRYLTEGVLMRYVPVDIGGRITVEPLTLQ